MRGNIEFLGSGKWFDAPQHIPYVFVVTVENKMHTGEGECYAAGASAFDKHNFVVKNHKSRKYKLFCHVTTEDNQHNSFNLRSHIHILLMEMMTLYYSVDGVHVIFNDKVTLYILKSGSMGIEEQLTLTQYRTLY